MVVFSSDKHSERRRRLPDTFSDEPWGIGAKYPSFYLRPRPRQAPRPVLHFKRFASHRPRPRHSLSRPRLMYRPPRSTGENDIEGSLLPSCVGMLSALISCAGHAAWARHRDEGRVSSTRSPS